MATEILPILQSNHSCSSQEHGVSARQQHSETAPNKVDVSLVVPPVWEMSFQSLGIPTLAAWSRMLGYAVDQIDLNVGFYRDLCGDKQFNMEMATEEYQKLLSDPLYQSECQPRTDDLMIRLDLPFGYNHIICNNYSKIKPFLRNTRFNFQLRYFLKTHVAERLADPAPGKIRVVGMTVEGENQAIGALTLARLIKQRNPEAITVIGGPWVTGLRNVLREEPVMLEHIDFIVPNKGELPLQNILEAVADSQGMPTVPVGGTITRLGDEFTGIAPFGGDLKTAEIPAPDLFDLTDYNRSNVLPYESERGCYWGHCKFCHHIQHYTHAYNSKPIAKVISDLKAYQKRFSFAIAAFVDAAMPPRRMREMADAFLASNIGLRWACFSKVEKQFTPEIFRLAARSGLDVVSFGVETAGGRLAQFIGKPLDPEVSARVLKDCAEAGIYTTAGIMNGLPSETFEDLDRLWRFLDGLKHYTYLHPHLFKFEKGTEFYDNADKYGIEILPNHAESRLSVYAQFVDRNPGPLTRDYIRKNRVNQEWWKHNMGRSLNWKTQSDQFCKAVQYIVNN